MRGKIGIMMMHTHLSSKAEVMYLIAMTFENDKYVIHPQVQKRRQ